MTIYHFELAHTGTGLAGGDICALELIKYYQSKKIRNVLFSTNHGKIAYLNYGIIENQYLEIQTINASGHERILGVFFSYIIRVAQGIWITKKYELKDDDVLICHSEFLPNIVPFFLFQLKNRIARKLYWFHAKAPRLFYGYKGEYSNRLSLPRPTILYYILTQQLARILTPKDAVILCVNPYHLHYLQRVYSRQQVIALKIYGGQPLPYNTSTKDKIYDAAWMGRFQGLKGLDYLLHIVQILSKLKPDFKIVILGGGTASQIEKFTSTVRERGIQDHIEYKGFMIGEARFETIKKAKVFFQTSYYENRSQVILESLSLGIPVVAFDLPTYVVYNRGIIKVPLGNTDLFSNEALRLLSDMAEYEKQRDAGVKFASDYSWEHTFMQFDHILHETTD